MPNWCANRLTVSGPKADLDSFRAKASCLPSKECGHEYPQPLGLCPRSFLGDPQHWFFPMRSEPDPEEPEHGLIVPVEGTTDDEEEPTPTLTYEYLTRWGPADDVLKVMALQHPALAFVNEYAEPLMDFSGREKFEGETVEEEMTGQARDSELSAEAPFFY